MPRMQKISRNNTVVIDKPGLFDVWLHGHKILSIVGNEVVVDNCGYNTVMTQTRLNQAFNERRLPLHYSRRNGGELLLGGLISAKVESDGNGRFVTKI